MNVEQQAVSAAGAAGIPDRGIDRDVVALRWAAVRTHALPPAVCRDPTLDNGLSVGAQRGAVGSRRRAGAATRLDDAVERRRDELIAEDDVATFERDDIAAGRARRIDF